MKQLARDRTIPPVVCSTSTCQTSRSPVSQLNSGRDPYCSLHRWRLHGQISRPYEQSFCSRFHSLAFHSLAQVEAFFVFLNTQPTEWTPKIEHLYLSFVEEIELPKPKPGDGWTERFVGTMTRLFALVGPYIRTLCILEPWRFILPSFPQIDTLPNLQELTLDGACDLLSLSEGPSADRDGGVRNLSSRFPALERLHYLCRDW